MKILNRLGCVALLAAGCLILLSGGIDAQQETPSAPAADATDLPDYQELEIPESELSQFPLGDWIPFQVEAFKQLINPKRITVDPSESCTISRARYSAAYEEGSLQGGNFVFSITKFGSGTRRMPFGPSNLPLREIAWRDRPASVGTLNNGQGLLVVDRDSGDLVGKWDLSGTRTKTGAEFTLELPQAAVSLLELQIPEQLKLTVNDPAIIVKAGNPEEGKRLWTVTLGTRTACRLTIQDTKTDSVVRSAPLYRQENTYSIRRDGVRLRTQLQLQVVGSPLPQLSLDVDRDLQVISATYGVDIPLQWNDDLTEQGRIVTIRFPDPLTEAGRPIYIQFAAPSRISQDWLLPKVRLREAVVEENLFRLQVEAPLELKTFTPQGCHQIGIDATDPPIRSFLADAADAGLEVFVGTPVLQSGCLISGQVQCDKEYWTGEFELDFLATSGVEFTIPIKILPEWEIIEVRAGSLNSSSLQEQAHWDVSGRPDRSQVLTVELQDALRPGSPRRVFLRIRRPAPQAEKTVPVPFVQPDFTVSPLNLLVKLVYDRQSSAVLEPGSSFEIVPPSDLPENWRDSQFWQSRIPGNDKQFLFLRLNDSTPTGEMFVRSTQTSLSGNANVIVDFGDERIQEQITLEIVPQGRAERILVYLSDSGEELTWNAADSGSFSIDAVRLPSSRHAVWKTPAQGELWELNLSTPQSEPFQIRGMRGNPRGDRGKVALPWLPQADIFEGEVRITTRGSELPRLEVQGGEILQFNRQARRTSRPEPRTALWQYSHTGQEELFSSITYSYPRKSTEEFKLPAAIASFRIRPARTRESQDLYEADFVFNQQTPLQVVKWNLRSDVELIEAFVEGTRVEFSRRGDEIRFASPVITQGKEFRMTYAIPNTQLLSRTLIFPVPAFPIASVDWTLIVPDGLAVAEWPQAWGTPDQSPDRIWRQLWMSSTEATPSYLQGPRQRASQPGDRVWTGRTLTLPASVALNLWDRAFFIPIAWLSLLISTALRLATRRLPLFNARPHLIPAVVVLLLLLTGWASAGWSFVILSIAVGLILGTILPQWWIPRNLENTTSEDHPIAAEKTRLLTRIGGMILVAASLATSDPISAQQIPFAPQPFAPQPSTPPSLPLKVLIPTSPEGTQAESDRLLYLSPGWKPWLERLTRNSEPPPNEAYWIHTADHELEVHGLHDLRYRLKLEIELLDPSQPLELRIPVTNLLFGGDNACLIDGNPTSLLNLPGTSEVQLTILPPASTSTAAQPGSETNPSVSESPAPKTRRVVELRGFPVPQGEEKNWHWETAVPTVIDSKLTVKFDRPPENWQVTSARGVPRWNDDRTEMRVALGPVSSLKTGYSVERTVKSAVTECELTPLGLIEIGSGTINYNVRLKLRLLQGTLDQLPLLLPPGVIVRELSADAVAIPFALSESEAGTLLTCTPAEPLRDQAEWRLKFQLDRINSAKTNLLPPLRWASEKSPIALRIPLQEFALRTQPDQSLTLPPDPGEAVSVIPIELFLESWGMESPAPQAAFRLNAPTPIEFKTAKLQDPPSVSEEFLNIVIRPHRAHFTWGLTVANQPLQPRFQYEIQLPSLLQVESVAVTQDGAGRLLNWTRQGDKLRIFLREQTSGLQKISIGANLPIQIPAELKLPDIRLMDVPPTSYRVDLSTSPQLSAEWSDPDGLEKLADLQTSELNAGSEVRLGSWRAVAGKSDRILRVDNNQPQITGSLAVLVEKNSPSWRLNSHVVFRVTRGFATRFHLKIPATMPAPRIEAEGAAQSSEPLPDQSGTLVTLTPTRAVRDRFHVQITSEIPPPRTLRWTVPRISTPEVDLSGSFLIMTPPDLIEESESPDSGLRNGNLIPELQEVLPPAQLGQSKVLESYRGDEAWIVTLRQPAVRPTTGNIQLAEDQIRFGETGQLLGRVSLTLSQPPGRTVEFSLPSPLKLDRVLANGQPLDPQVQGENFSVRLPTGAEVFRVDIDWTQESLRRSPLPVLTEIALPKIIAPAIDRRFAVLHLPENRFFLGSPEGKTVNWWDWIIERDESLASLRQPIRFFGRWGNTLLDQLRTATSLQQSRLIRPLTDDQTKRLQQLMLDLRERNETVPPDASASDQPPALELTYPSPDSVRIFKVSADDPQVGIRMVSRELIWGLVTLGGLLLIRFVLPRLPFGWLNNLSDRSPAIGWMWCGVLWAAFCTPSWLALAFVLPAAINWWNQREFTPLTQEQPLPTPHESSSPSTPSA